MKLELKFEEKDHPAKRAWYRGYLRQIVTAVKNRPCIDCEREFETRKMSLDHLPQFSKVAEIDKFVSSKSFRKLLVEIAKCDVVCLECHGIREWKRGRHGLPH